MDRPIKHSTHSTHSAPLMPAGDSSELIKSVPGEHAMLMYQQTQVFVNGGDIFILIPLWFLDLQYDFKTVLDLTQILIRILITSILMQQTVESTLFNQNCVILNKMHLSHKYNAGARII